MKQICMASTLFGGMTVAAAIDSGVIDPKTDGERILLVSNNAAAPELVVPWHESPVARGIVARFDRVILLNDVLHPFHPSKWTPEDADLPVLERLLRSYWSLGDEPLHLLLDSLHVPPSATLVRVFSGATISVLSEGLMSYGPTRFKQQLDVVQRLRRLVYLDLLPGVDPVLLSETGIELARVDVGAFTRIVSDLADAADDGPNPLPAFNDRRTSLILGQYLSSLGILAPDEEVRLSLRMVDAAVEHGAERVVFKPHPSAAPAMIEALRMEAERKGAEFSVLSTPYPAEMLATRTDFDSVASFFSTALVTLSRMYGVTPISVGTELLMGRLTPFQNSNRIPLTVVDALTRTDASFAEPAELQRLIDAVAYCMQPRLLPHLRPVALEFFGSVSAQERKRYADTPQLRPLGLDPTVPSRLTPAYEFARRARRYAARKLKRGY